MFVSSRGLRKQLHTVMACEQKGKSDSETVDPFDEEIYRSSYTLDQSGPLFRASVGDICVSCLVLVLLIMQLSFSVNT